MQMIDDEKEKNIMQLNEQQLIILQSIPKALILIKGLKVRRLVPMLLYCFTLSCLNVILILVHTNTNMTFPKP